MRPNADALVHQRSLVRQLYVAALLRFIVKTVWLRSVGLSAVVLARGVQLPCPISHLVTDPPQPSLPVGSGLWIEISFFHRCVVGIKTSIQPWKRAGLYSDSHTPTLGMP